MYKISKPPKKQVLHRKKDNRDLKFKQTMATNLRLGNTRNAVENHCWPPSWNSLLGPRFPRRATRRPRVSGVPRPPTSASRLPSLAWGARKNNTCFSGNWSKVFEKYCFSEWNQKYLNLKSSSWRNLLRADRESLASYISFVGATKPKEIGASARRPFLWFFCFIQFGSECWRLRVNGGYQDSWG